MYRKELAKMHQRVRRYIEISNDLKSKLDDIQRLDYIKSELIKLCPDRPFRAIIDNVHFKDPIEKLFDVSWSRPRMSMIDCSRGATDWCIHSLETVGMEIAKNAFYFENVVSWKYFPEVDLRSKKYFGKHGKFACLRKTRSIWQKLPVLGIIFQKCETI
jgi:hypothetical protein